MSKRIEKILVIVSVFSLVFGFSAFPSNAESTFEYISLKTFEKAMNEIYTEYGSSFKVVDDNGVEYIPKEYANEMYQKAEMGLKKDRVITPTPVNTTLRRVMPVNYYNCQTFVVAATIGLGRASFAHECRGTVNAQYNTFMSLTYSGVYQSGFAVDFESYNISNLQHRYINGNTNYHVSFNIDVTFSYTDPLGIKYSETVRNYVSSYFPASAY